jgi:hypothetical protein
MLNPGILNQALIDEIESYLASISSTISGTITIAAADETIQLDEAAGSITYVGYAPVGTATSAAAWKIKRLDESGSPELIILFADGNSNYDNIWSNRAALSYS